MGVTYFFVATPLYRAQVTLQFHATSQQNQGLSSSLGIGLALAGLQSEKSLPERVEGFGILKSRIFLLPFIEKMHLARPMFGNRFDTSKNSWKRGTPPTPETLHREFVDSVMAVDDNSATGLITISIFLPSAEQAAAVANALVGDLNEKLRLDAVSRANENLSYLDKQLASNQVAEIRVAIAQLVQTEMKRLLLASSRTTHTFQVIDPAMTPDRLYAPRPLLTATLSFLVAFLISLFVVVIRFLANSRTR
jgi:uncharacterized protein involved in exopolysaccharide biosynthesis